MWVRGEIPHLQDTLVGWEKCGDRESCVGLPVCPGPGDGWMEKGKSDGFLVSSPASVPPLDSGTNTPEHLMEPTGIQGVMTHDWHRAWHRASGGEPTLEQWRLQSASWRVSVKTTASQAAPPAGCAEFLKPLFRALGQKLPLPTPTPILSTLQTQGLCCSPAQYLEGVE